MSPQGTSQRRQSATQAPGPAGHGAAAQAVALQAQRQPLPHQDGEDPAGARLADDARPGEPAVWCRREGGVSVVELLIRLGSKLDVFASGCVRILLFLLSHS